MRRAPYGSPYRHRTRIIEPPNVTAACAAFALVVGAVIAGYHVVGLAVALVYALCAGRVGGRAPSWRTYTVVVVLFDVVAGGAFLAGRHVVGVEATIAAMLACFASYVAATRQTPRTGDKITDLPAARWPDS